MAETHLSTRGKQIVLPDSGHLIPFEHPEAVVAAIREVLKTLPVRPGVYRMQDTRGDVLYVGKARALKNRVTNYTQVAKLPKRLQRMVAQTRSMTVVTTRTEIGRAHV